MDRGSKIYTCITASLLIIILFGGLLECDSKNRGHDGTYSGVKHEEKSPFVKNIINNCKDVEDINCSKSGNDYLFVYARTKYSVNGVPIYVNFKVNNFRKYIENKKSKNPFKRYAMVHEVIPIPNGFGRVYYQDDEELCYIISDYINYITDQLSQYNRIKKNYEPKRN